jgi:lipopolysaccharide/colanic/teichoic acid biosynthesis glycosyltransferase
VREKGVDLLVVAIPERQAKLPMMELLHCKFAGVEVEDGLTFYEHHTDKLYVRELYPAWLVFNQGFRISPMTEAAKRIFDIAVSLVALVLTSPLIVLLGLVVALTSKGPMFFSQVRTGRFGKDFKIYKLRSMRMDTGEDVGDGRSSAAEAPDTWNPDTDRITLIGRIMRRLHLDELPQFWNVLIGNMAVVGPRPERPEYIARLENSIPFYTQRHLVKPGVTGLAQVMYDYGASVEGSMEKLQYDLCYIRHLSISSDVLTVLRTLRVVLFGRERR